MVTENIPQIVRLRSKKSMFYGDSNEGCFECILLPGGVATYDELGVL